MNRMRVFMTGASGNMGFPSFKEIYKRRPDVDFSLLLVDEPRERRLFSKYTNDSRVSIVYGDLRNYEDVKAACDGCDFVLHIGGMVSPIADYLPLQTMEVNIKGAENIVRAVKAQKNADDIKVVYIGTVAQTGDRNEPIHWGRTGDPIKISIYDHYALSKVKAERIFAESGLKYWVSLRQTGILYPAILRNMDPIMFHVVLRGVLEWATIEDSATLMCNVLSDDVPESFWGEFYNIGSGAEYRLTNYEFENKLLNAIGMGLDAPKKIFNPNWFITRNFHGQWYIDSDKLENILHFRHNVPVDDYFAELKKSAPWFASIAFLGSNILGKIGMYSIASNKVFGTLSWIGKKDENRMSAFFGSYEKWQKIPSSWKETDLSRPSDNAIILHHGYDETKPIGELDIDDMREAAKFRGGECLSETMAKGDIFRPLKWRCAFGHEFYMTPNTVLRGGHWCPSCDPMPWNYDKIAKANPFFAQVWYPHHDVNENHTYSEEIYNNYDEYIKLNAANRQKSVISNIQDLKITGLVLVFIMFIIAALLIISKVSI
jgi:nucleoside-diphosphate-sugar epimerase